MKSLKSSTRSISKKHIKKINSTMQPIKPADVRIDPAVENEGSSFRSFKTGKLSNIK